MSEGIEIRGGGGEIEGEAGEAESGGLVLGVRSVGMGGGGCRAKVGVGVLVPVLLGLVLGAGGWIESTQFEDCAVFEFELAAEPAVYGVLEYDDRVVIWVLFGDRHGCGGF